MNHMQFLFEKNDCKVYKLTVLNHSYFIVDMPENDISERVVQVLMD